MEPGRMILIAAVKLVQHGIWAGTNNGFIRQQRCVGNLAPEGLTHKLYRRNRHILFLFVWPHDTAGLLDCNAILIGMAGTDVDERPKTTINCVQNTMAYR